MNVLKGLFSKYVAGGPRRSWLPANQNGRSPVPVSDAQLLKARDDLIRRQRSGARRADPAAIRANWPLEKLARECAEAWSNGKVLTLGAHTGFSGSMKRRSTVISSSRRCAIDGACQSIHI